MAAKTWALSDLEGVAKTDGFACLPVVLLNRIVREAALAFDAPASAIASEADTPRMSNGMACLRAALRFNTVKLSWGAPSVDVMIEQRGERFNVRIGAAENTTGLGYSYEFGWADETPAALFPALFACALESMRPR